MGPFANDGVRGIDGSGREVTLVMQFFGGFFHFLYLDSACDSVIYIGIGAGAVRQFFNRYKFKNFMAVSGLFVTGFVQVYGKNIIIFPYFSANFFLYAIKNISKIFSKCFFIFILINLF